MLAVTVGAKTCWAQPDAGGPGPGGGGTCRADADHYCGTEPNLTLDEVEKCLSLHANELSEQCRRHLIEENVIAPEAVGSGGSGQICQPDQVRYCPSLPISGSVDAAYECLGRHLKELSPGCLPQVQAGLARAEQNAQTKVILDCKVESAGFCKGLPLRGFLFLDCLLKNEKKTGQVCQAALEAAKPFRKDLKGKYKGPSRPWWHFW
jgi:hypothetical protein